MEASWEDAKKLAQEKGLDAMRLHKALNWLAPHGEVEESIAGQVETFRQAMAGEWGVLPKGTIVWRDRTNPSRHELDRLYNQA